MVSVISLWLPILVSAVLVFVVSSIVHTLLTYHMTDYDKTPNEDAVRSALRNLNLPPGDYAIPACRSQQERKSESFAAKMEEGPVAFLTMFPDGPPDMGRSLVQWFAYCLLVSVFAALVASGTTPAGSAYMSVFHTIGLVAFAAYGLALLQNSIWFRRKWSATFKSIIDALLYGAVTAGVFGWLWPG